MVNGWFVGNFEPSILKTDQFEVAIKSYTKGDEEVEHFHKIAIEITLVISGRVEMCKQIWEPGSIIILNPGEATSFKALEDSVTAVVKTPSVRNDKYELK